MRRFGAGLCIHTSKNQQNCQKILNVLAVSTLLEEEYIKQNVDSV